MGVGSETPSQAVGRMVLTALLKHRRRKHREMVLAYEPSTLGISHGTPLDQRRGCYLEKCQTNSESQEN